MTLLEATEAVRSREPLFHRPEHGTTPADFDRMMAPDFWEVGASGARYTRAYILETLTQRHAEPVKEDDLVVEDFSCTHVADAVYLATYTLTQSGNRITRRATLWRHTPEGWHAVYHQGTVVS